MTQIMKMRMMLKVQLRLLKELPQVTFSQVLALSEHPYHIFSNGNTNISQLRMWIVPT